LSAGHLLLVKVGTEPGLEPIVNRLRLLLPKVKLFGITTEHSSTHTLYDVSVATSNDTVLGSYPELSSNTCFVRPELYELVMKHESALLRICERVALHDLTSVARPHFPIPMFNNSFDDRQQLVLRQFAFWDHVLQHHEINAVVSQNYGHNLWDFALEIVTRSRQIPYLFFHEVRPFLSSQYVCESVADLDDLSFGKHLINKANSRGWSVGDSTERKSRMLEQSGISRRPEASQVEVPETQSSKRSRPLVRLRHYSRYPLQKLRKTIRRRILTHKSKQEEKSVSTSTIPNNYVFMELQSQPNGTTARKGWMYPDLREMVGHISQNLREGQTLVVRESPRQWARMYPRRTGFWKSIAAIPRVVVVHATVPVDELVRNATALIETSYSTLALDAVSQGTPVIVLGHTHLRGILGVFAVGVHGDLAHSMQLAEEFACKKPSLSEIGRSIDLWTNETRDSTIEGALSSFPTDVADRNSYIDRITQNVAGVIAAWVVEKI